MNDKIIVGKRINFFFFLKMFLVDLEMMYFINVGKLGGYGIMCKSKGIWGIRGMGIRGGIC